MRLVVCFLTVLAKVISGKQRRRFWQDIDEPCPMCFAWSPTGELCLVGMSWHPNQQPQHRPRRKSKTKMPVLTSRRGRSSGWGETAPASGTEVERQHTVFGSCLKLKVSRVGLAGKSHRKYHCSKTHIDGSAHQASDVIV